jgi:hypothetical protein
MDIWTGLINSSLLNKPTRLFPVRMTPPFRFGVSSSWMNTCFPSHKDPSPEVRSSSRREHFRCSETTQTTCGRSTTLSKEEVCSQLPTMASYFCGILTLRNLCKNTSFTTTTKGQFELTCGKKNPRRRARNSRSNRKFRLR